MTQTMDNMSMAEKADFYCIGEAEILCRLRRNWDVYRASGNPLCDVLAAADPDPLDPTRPRITQCEIIATRARMIEEIEAIQ